MKRLLLLLLFIQITGFAQQNYLPSYIIKKGNSDSIKLKINYLEWDRNPTKIEVLHNDGLKEEFDIKSLKSFGIYGKDHYRISKIGLDISPHQTDKLEYSREPIIINDTTLALRYLVNGSYSLYYLKDENIKEHFFIESDGKISELINHYFIQNYNSRLAIRNFPLYKGFFTKEFQGCNILFNDQMHEKWFNRKNLIKAVKELNDCKGKDYIVYFDEQRENPTLAFGLHLGYDFENKNFHHRGYWDNIDEHYIDRTSSIAPGFIVQIGLPRRLNNNQLYFETYYNRENITNISNDYSLNLDHINFSVLYKSLFRSPQSIQPYLAFGASGKFLLNSKESRRFQDLETVQIRGIAEVGFKRSQFEVFTRAKVNIGPRVYTYYYRKIVEAIDRFNYRRPNFQLGFNYFFNSKERQ